MTGNNMCLYVHVLLTVRLGDHLGPDLSGEGLDLLVEELAGYPRVPHMSHGSQDGIGPGGSKLERAQHGIQHHQPLHVV